MTHRRDDRQRSHAADQHYQYKDPLPKIRKTRRDTGRKTDRAEGACGFEQQFQEFPSAFGMGRAADLRYRKEHCAEMDNQDTDKKDSDGLLDT